MKDSLKPGLRHTMTYVVPANRTVPYLLPESEHFATMPEVLATGYMVGIIEWTCMEAIRAHLDEGEISLGAHVDLSHRAPTPVGMTVTIEVELIEVDQRALTFEVEARDEKTVISTGLHRRGVVNKERFVERLNG